MTITITWRQLVAFCVFVLLATLLTWWVEQPAPDAAPPANSVGYVAPHPTYGPGNVVPDTSQCQWSEWPVYDGQTRLTCVAVWRQNVAAPEEE